MVMDPRFSDFSDSMSGFKFDDESTVIANGFKYKDETVDLSFMNNPLHPPDPDLGNFVPSFALSSEVNSHADSPDDFSDTVVKYLNQILMEENMEEKPSMFHDPLTLQAAEKSFYEVLGEKYPPSTFRPSSYVDQSVDSGEENFFGSSSEYSTNSSTSANHSTDPQWFGDSISKSSVVQSRPLDYPSQSSSQISSQWSFASVNGFGNKVYSPVDSSASTHLVSNIFSDNESILQFKRGMEEASKFLPSASQLVIDLDNYTLPPKSEEGALGVVVKVEKDERNTSPNGSRGRKHHFQPDSDFEEGRSSKQSAVYVEEAELSEMFDRVLLLTNAKGEPVLFCEEQMPSEVGNTLQQDGQAPVSNGVKTRAKKQGNKSEAVDLRTLLISCAQSVAADDRRTANEQLKQIRQHSSDTGDASQRLAHIFADGLEARLAGTGTQIYAALASKKISAAEKLKAYQVYLSACPFEKIAIFLANKMIMRAISTGRTLHVIDFGIQYGFQWPILIQHLSALPDGSPKLRITGIELPQAGFRPAEQVEETGRRLASYCERFNVPFEYHAIATQKWETIKIEDLNIKRDEVLAVNTLFRFQNLLDETVVENSPRDAVLKLIRKIQPNIFVNTVTNGSYSAPFFVTRFREALFHYSALFDMFDTTLPREDKQRLHFEKEFSGREAMNVIACEGLERVERPETYKQWQVRIVRAGFRPIPLDPELVKKFKGKVKVGYHKDFVLDEDVAEGSVIMMQFLLEAAYCPPYRYFDM
ncbi:hypothetical protein RJ639_002835 [Escallonia herrerae]|uniref:Scarecrow-like protein 14 n=1 Tax=Escallonia herrerae TaxID=1293975 RepID=A0AA89AY25_9ASTE|nr:hypothetical protein RJ639_002835 [Escallonia herrerae]